MIVVKIIKVYQKIVSPFLGRRCRFYPTCSEYAIESVESHGVVKGLFFSFLRILRCNPFCKCGYDPVKNFGDE